MEQFEKIVRLSNGSRFVLQHSSSAVSYMGLFVAVGSRNDGNIPGAAHLIEHTVFKGTAHYNYSQLMNLVESVGGEVNAYTAKEETCYQIAIPNQFLRNAIMVLAEIFSLATFPSAELRKEKAVVVDEIVSYEDSPSENIYDDFEELLFDGTSLAHNILGTKGSVRRASSKGLRARYGELYTPDRLVVSYLGSLDLDYVCHELMNFFAPLPSGRGVCASSPENFPRGTNFFVERREGTHQAHCVLGSYAPGAFDEMRFATSMLANILGGVSFNSLLNIRLREENGLTYNIEANYTPYSDAGVFAIYFGTDYEKVEQCKKIIFELFNEIIDHGFPVETLDAYKRQYVGQLALSEDNYMSLMLAAARSCWWYNHVDSYSEIVEKIQSITNDNIKETAERILSRKAINALIYR